MRPPAQILARRTIKPIAKGESVTLSSDLFADLVPGTGAVSVSVGSLGGVRCGGPARRARPLSVPLLGADNEPGAAAALCQRSRQGRAGCGRSDTDQRIRDAIEALLTRQDSNGSFGLWGVGGNDVWLDSYVTDFLTRARERKIAVPDAAFKLALDRLRNEVANITDPGKNGGTDLAYALYVLARNGIAPIGDLRYLADAKLDALSTPIAKAQIAAALAMVGDRTRAERVYAAALAAIAPASQPDLFGREDYGSTLRDAAAVVALASESGAAPATVQAAVQRVEQVRANLRPTSTQEDAWLLLAASAMAKDAGKVTLDVGGTPTTARALPHHPRRRPQGAVARDQHRRGSGAGGGDGYRRADDAGARGGKGLQDRAPDLHARWRSVRHQRGEAEHAASWWCCR